MMEKQIKPPLYLGDGRLNKKYIRLLKAELSYNSLPVGQPSRLTTFQCEDCLLFFDNPHLIETHQKGYKHRGIWMIMVTIYADLTSRVQKQAIETYPSPLDDEVEMQYGTCMNCETELTDENVWAEHWCKECARKAEFIS